MKHDSESLFAITAAGAVAAAAVMALPKSAFADDITIETQAFVSSRTRGEVQEELLGQHQHLLGGPEPRAGEAGLRQGDELGGAVLQSQCAKQRKAQRRVHLGGVLPGDFDYDEYTLEARHYQTIGRLGVLATRAPSRNDEVSALRR